MPRAVLFDVDGTLTDTNHLHVVAWWEALRQAGHQMTLREIHRAIGLSATDLIAHLLGDDRDGDIAAVPADFHVDAPQYEAELARAAADHNGEEPVDTISRLLEQTLADSGWFVQWGCVLTGVTHDARSQASPRNSRAPRASMSHSTRSGERAKAQTVLGCAFRHLAPLSHHQAAVLGSVEGGRAARPERRSR
ncbi:HAD family hydrolase [Streptomyces cucumeris]|uniref:HAD family hydrolase n=1 Tax=Streptomyces cucumeris TaxID=2962890 RepID=UPI003D736415